MKDYAEQVAAVIREETGKEVKVQVNIKNGIEKTAVVVLDGTVNPTIYVEEFKNHGIVPERAAKEIIKVLGEINTPDIDITKITDWDKAKQTVFAHVVGTKHAEKQLLNVPHTEVEGSEGTLAYVYRIEIDNEANTLVNNSFLKQWGVEVEELHEIAMKNTPEQRPVTINGCLDELLKIYDQVEWGDFPIDDLEEIKNASAPLSIITCTQKLYGFGAVLYPHTIEMLTALYPERTIYVLPSSLHEALVIPSDDEDELEEIMYYAKMVKEVNAEQVPSEDKLVDAVYAIKDGKFCLAYSKIN